MNAHSRDRCASPGDCILSADGEIFLIYAAFVRENIETGKWLCIEQDAVSFYDLSARLLNCDTLLASGEQSESSVSR